MTPKQPMIAPAVEKKIPVVEQYQFSVNKVIRLPVVSYLFFPTRSLVERKKDSKGTNRYNILLIVTNQCFGSLSSYLGSSSRIFITRFPFSDLIRGKVTSIFVMLGRLS